MTVTYEFHMGEGKKILSVDPEGAGKNRKGHTPAAWTRLGHCQCSNCPLSTEETEYCPAAIEMEPVIEEFKNEKGFQKMTIRVQTEQRTYEKYTHLEEGLRSLLGLVMANSACPHLSDLRPMAMHHMPFSNASEFIMRSVSHYLLQQYFNKRDGKEQDWDLQGLVARNEELKLVNHSLWQRIHDVCEGDSSLKALLNFFSMASNVSSTLDTQLNQVRKHFDTRDPG